MDGNFDEVAIGSFKLGFPTKHSLRKSLTGKLVISVCQLMDRIDKYKRVKEDQQQGKGKDKAVNTVFRKPVHQVLEKIKNEPFFKRPNKMVGNPERRNHNLYCQYHHDHGHTTEDCKSLWDHLDQLVREGKIKQFLHHSQGQGSQASSGSQRDNSSRPLLGTINVTFRTIQPHNDALVVTLKIGGYDVKRVMVDQGSGAEIMYLDLYKGLKLRPEHLTTYTSLLISFDGKVVIPMG
nr:uncharacterized protein LOC111990313 [Quercus suber]